MIASSCGAAACSVFPEMRSESEWCGNNLLPLGNSIRREPSRSGSRKYDFITGAYNSCNVLGSAQEINSLSDADLSMSLISSEYWPHDSSIMDISFPSQTVHDTDRISVPVLNPREGDDVKLPSYNCIGDYASSEITTNSVSNRTTEQTFQHHNTARSGSVEIKVEVDPNLYVNCETSVDGDSWSDSHLKNTQCNKSSITSFSKTLSKPTSKQDVYVNNSDVKHFGVTSNRFNVVNRHGQVGGSNNLKQLSEHELDDKLKSVCSEESESEASELSENGSEFYAEAAQVEESSDSYDFMRNFKSEEQIDMQLSGFYRFECDKCGNKPVFSNFKSLAQHCRVQHQTKGCVSCCGLSMWERGKLVEHMLDHKHTYRWDKYTSTFIITFLKFMLFT
jgi:hypothetical protein